MRLLQEIYTDASFNDDVDKGRSTIGHVVLLNNCSIAWKSKLTSTTPQSIMESELIAANMGAKEGQWVRHLIVDLTNGCWIAPILFCDNDPCINTITNARVTERSKHIRPKFYYIRELVEKVELLVEPIQSRDQLADILTKALALPQFGNLCERLGVGSADV
jgi:hypothetical protein